MSDKIMEAGFDHPCKQTCSGWSQGRDRGRLESQPLIKLLAGEIDQLKLTLHDMNQNCISTFLHEQRVKALEDEIQKLKDANLRETCYAADLKVELDTLRDNLKGLIKPT